MTQTLLQYASTYCSGGNDCVDGTFPLDCAHFVAHILKAGEVDLDGPVHRCHSGTATASAELIAAFINASEIYDNVKVSTDRNWAAAGDYAFLLQNLGAGHDHCMLLAGPVDSTGAMVYGHTNNRCGQSAIFDPTQCNFYRIS